MSHSVLVGEDDATTRYLLELYCRDEPYDLTFANDGSKTIELFKNQDFDILVTDVRMPGVDGQGILSFAQETRPEVPVIVITGYGTIDDAVDFLRRGAFDYLAKPFTRDNFLHRLSLAGRNVDLRNEVDRLRRNQDSQDEYTILTADPAMNSLISRLPSLSKTDAAVIVTGERGTGQELCARAVHSFSPRVDQKFVSISCAALPENLIESELFGHVRGAFTDAHSDRPGLVEEAKGGTLFLDEVGELPLTVQAKLLRFLQEREYKPVGSNITLTADVRIVSATNRDLEKEVAANRFREDLFYRLNVLPIELPPLRDRPGDIPLLASHFMTRFAHSAERPIHGYAQQTLDAMVAYEWPGNVRELINRVQRMVVFTETGLVGHPAWIRSGHGNTTSPRHQEASVTAIGFKAAKKTATNQFEANYIRRILRVAGGNIAAAARLAHIDRKNLWALMKKHEIDADEYRK